jgi:hypothetical protein
MCLFEELAIGPLNGTCPELVNVLVRVSSQVGVTDCVVKLAGTGTSTKYW